MEEVVVEPGASSASAAPDSDDCLSQPTPIALVESIDEALGPDIIAGRGHWCITLPSHLYIQEFPLHACKYYFNCRVSVHLPWNVWSIFTAASMSTCISHFLGFLFLFFSVSLSCLFSFSYTQPIVSIKKERRKAKWIENCMKRTTCWVLQFLPSLLANYRQPLSFCWRVNSICLVFFYIDLLESLSKELRVP